MSPLVAALLAAVVAGGLGLLVPVWLARLPEPVPDPPAPAPDEPPGDAPAEEVDAVPGTVLAAAPPKEPYADIAALPWLRPVAVVGSAAVAGMLGLLLGAGGALVVLVPLVPVLLLLLVVDWRTTLLPTRVIHPTYAALAVLLPVAALLDRDLDALVRAGLGWLVVGGWFWVCWWLLGAWGFGDVRLSRVLGPVLGYLGWAETVTGLLLMLLLGALGGVLLSLRHRALRRRYPYGPFMIVGALAAVAVGPDLARLLGYA